jgi:hypothetical protein
MKQVTVQLQAHVQSEVTSLCVCWLVMRQDGTQLGFTEHDEDIEITDWVSPNDVLNATLQSSFSLLAHGDSDILRPLHRQSGSGWNSRLGCHHR